MRVALGLYGNNSIEQLCDSDVRVKLEALWSHIGLLHYQVTDPEIDHPPDDDRITKSRMEI